MPTVLVQNEALECEIDEGENLQKGLARYGVTVYDFSLVHPFVKPLSAAFIVFIVTLACCIFGYYITGGMNGLYVGLVFGILSGSYPAVKVLLADHTQIIVMNGQDGLDEPTARELRVLGDERVAAGLRLASEATVKGDCEIHCHP